MCIQLLTYHHCRHPHPHHDHDQVTIAVPDVGEDANGQPHHHLVGEKPRYDHDQDDQLKYQIFSYFHNWKARSAKHGSFTDQSGFQGPSTQAAIEEEQGPLEISGTQSLLLFTTSPCQDHNSQLFCLSEYSKAVTIIIVGLQGIKRVKSKSRTAALGGSREGGYSQKEVHQIKNPQS